MKSISKKCAELSNHYHLLGAYPVADYASEITSFVNKNYNPSLANEKGIQLFKDKLEFYNQLNNSGVSTPYSVSKHSGYVVKPRFGNDSIGVVFFSNTENIPQIYNDHDYLIQKESKDNRSMSTNNC